MKQDSIFSRSRFEYDGSHLYYLDKARLEQIEGNSPVIIYGSRGTGKTTLLNALNWQEQSKNNYLIDALGSNKYSREYIGIYVKLPKLNVQALSRYKADNEQLYAQIFAFYLDLVWLEQLTLAISVLSSDKSIDVSTQEERTICSNILERYPFLVNGVGKKSKVMGFYDLSNSFRYLREGIEGSALHSEPISSIHKKLSLTGQVGDVGRTISKIIHCIWSEKGLNDYKFKICFDECECLDDFQVKILGTIVRLSDHPTFFVYSFISVPTDFYTTLVPNLFIAKADIQHIALDEMSDKEFQSFSQGVVTVRLKADGVELDGPLSEEKLFGKISINTCIGKILARSESKGAHDFMVSAKDQQQKNKYYESYINDDVPFYQAYLVQTLGLNIAENKIGMWSKAQRVQDSKEIRKKNVAAYLSICNDYKTAPIYAGSDVVFQVSDKSIRDYLWQLHEIYIEFDKPIEEFLNSEIPIEVQDKAIKRASMMKLQSLPSSPLTDPGKVYRLVFGLGRLTALIQSGSADNSHLKSPERGIFSVTAGTSEEEVKLIQLVVEAAEAGFLKIISSDQNNIKFRVHTSLAPYFCFSYRGAYYSVPITLAHLQQLRDSVGENALIDKVKVIAGSLYNMQNHQLSIEGL
jgi:energy-coupling factor transporter ATP-binding protein EcfA2